MTMQYTIIVAVNKIVVSCWPFIELLYAAENECPCIVYELPVSMAGEGEWYNSQ